MDIIISISWPTVMANAQHPPHHGAPIPVNARSVSCNASRSSDLEQTAKEEGGNQTSGANCWSQLTSQYRSGGLKLAEAAVDIVFDYV